MIEYRKAVENDRASIEALFMERCVWGIDHLACSNGSCQCTTYRTWNLCLEKAETYVVLVRPGSW